jgi:hypothetical protein
MANVHYSEEQTPPLAYDNLDRLDDMEQELGRELSRFQQAQVQQSQGPAYPATFQQTPPLPAAHKPLRMALSAVRDNLDRRTREWRGSAKVVEQSLRQLVAAEEARAQSLADLAHAEAEVARTGQLVTDALAAFDETDRSRDIDPLFEHSQAALEDLDRITNDLSIAQCWCRAAWKQYADALEREQKIRFHIQSVDLDS